MCKAIDDGTIRRKCERANENTDRTFVRFLLGVHPHVNEQFVSRVEGSRARTSLPKAGELILAARRRCGRSAEKTAVPRLLAVSLLVPIALHSSAVAVRVRRGRFYVPPLDVPHQALLFRERTTAVDPTALISRREVIVHWFRAICNM